MTSTPVHRQVAATHIRPLDASRDMGAVADLLQEAFQGELDWAGRRAISEMRWMGRWGGLLGWLDQLAFPESGLGPGYVWIEDGQVVGHLSMRCDGYSSRWLVGNVAVRAAYRGRGIARRLMDQAIEHVRQRGGETINLLVRADNLPAVRLYAGLGFRQTYALAYWQHPPRVRAARLYPYALLHPPYQVGDVVVRPARPSDQSALYNLARTGQPEEARWVEPVHRDDFYAGWDRRLGDWVSRRKRLCLVAEASTGIAGAVWADAPSLPQEGRLRIWTAGDYGGKLETALAGAALAALDAPVTALVCAFPPSATPTAVALAQFGFTPTKILAHLQLKLS